MVSFISSRSLAGNLYGNLVAGASALTDFLLPRLCLVCGRGLNLHEEHLCIWCEADLPLSYFWNMRNNPMSERLNETIQKKIMDRITADAYTNGDRIKFSYATSLFLYHEENNYKKIPQALKYLCNLEEGFYYAAMLGRMMKASRLYEDVDFIIPVPLHWTRHWKRGYNQAEVIAKAIGKELGIPVRTDMIRRGRRTRTQTKLNVAEKSKNVENAFTAIRNQSRHPSRQETSAVRHILVVDDVFTTGATISACFDAIRPIFGPKVRLSAATLAFVTQ